MDFSPSLTGLVQTANPKHFFILACFHMRAVVANVIAPVLQHIPRDGLNVSFTTRLE